MSDELRVAMLGRLVLSEAAHEAEEGYVVVDVAEGNERHLGALTMREATFEELLARQGPEIELASGVGAPDGAHPGRPFVMMSVGPMSAQADPDEIRKLGRECFAVAEEAEADAGVYRWMIDTLELDEKAAVAAVNHIRYLRRRRSSDGEHGDT